MKLTTPGKDVISIDESNLENYKREASKGTKFHVIKLNFVTPTKEKIDDVVKSFENTNRFIIADNIKFYNSHLKNVGKKYYVQNTASNFNKLLSFFRKNNKILVDFTKMPQAESRFLMEAYLEDVLANTEIIIIDENDMGVYATLLRTWPGNVIVRDLNYEI